MTQPTPRERYDIAFFVARFGTDNDGHSQALGADGPPKAKNTAKTSPGKDKEPPTSSSESEPDSEEEEEEEESDEQPVSGLVAISDSTESSSGPQRTQKRRATPAPYPTYPPIATVVNFRLPNGKIPTPVNMKKTYTEVKKLLHQAQWEEKEVDAFIVGFSFVFGILHAS